MERHIPTPSGLLTPEQTAEFLQVSPRTLRNLQRRKILPLIRLTNKIVRFRRVDVEAALQKLTVGEVR
jgi:hypothetical protein